MRDEHNRFVQAGLQLEQLILHFRSDQRVERTEGFVHQDHVRIRGECSGQSDTLFHATRKFIRVLLLVPFQANFLEPFGCGLQGARLRLTTGQQCERGILECGFVRHQPEALKDHADFTAPQFAQACLVKFGDIDTIHHHFAEGRLDQTVEMPNQRAFARTGQTHDHKNLARPNVQ